MMIAGGCDVRTVASYLRHASASMTLGIYADVDPKTKRAAVNKVGESFDAEIGGYGDAIMDSAIGAPKRRKPAPSSRWTSSRLCSPPQRRRKLDMGVFRIVWRFVRWLFRAVSRWM